MSLALVLPDENRAGLEAPVQSLSGFLAARQTIQQLDCLSIEAPERLLLDPVSDHSRDEVFGQSGRRRAAGASPPGKP
jgi:hypothetical protein